MAKKIVIADVVANELKMDGVTKVEGGQFTGQIRNMDFTGGLMEGDTITIPEEFDVLQVVLTEGTAPAQFIMVTVSDAAGNERGMRFFPNQLAKIAFPLDEEGKRLGKVKTTGTAAEKYQSYLKNDGGMNAAMKFFAGKQIKVNKDDSYTTENRFTGTVGTTHIYQYDLV